MSLLWVAVTLSKCRWDIGIILCGPSGVITSHPGSFRCPDSVSTLWIMTCSLGSLCLFEINISDWELRRQLLWFTRTSVTKDFKRNFTPSKFPIQMQHRLLKLLKPAAASRVGCQGSPATLTGFILSFLQGNQDLFFAGTSHGTFHVSLEGTLSIQGKYSKFPIKYFL